ncbi:hypothetical protein ACFPL7_16850 [Dongia soli]|uniref:Intracellular septation protein A n=1 Tax=Dongia soli TaxID=600628 RepID=A0ABU5E6B9_9PROT|nr:hypothetical protein [Dongia soli]MDY0881259.1 hypothetical protein [Dongia soli]
MPMSKVTKHLSLFFATLLLGFVISGKDGPIAIYLGYFSFGYLAPMLLLRSGRKYTALVLWTFLLVIFAFVFEADRMMWPDYRPTRDGIAVLCAVPMLAMVLGCGFMLIDRLMRVERPLEKAGEGKAYNPHASPGIAAAAKTDKAYPPLLGFWFLWPLGALVVAVLDGNRWDRMRYDNSLLVSMFGPPLIATLAFFLYRYLRDRQRARQAAALETRAPGPLDASTGGTQAG